MPHIRNIREDAAAQDVLFDVSDDDHCLSFAVSWQALDEALRDGSHTALENFATLRSDIETVAFERFARAVGAGAPGDGKETATAVIRLQAQDID